MILVKCARCGFVDLAAEEDAAPGDGPGWLLCEPCNEIMAPIMESAMRWLEERRRP